MMITDDMNINVLVEKVLAETELGSKRAGKCDEADFLKYVCLLFLTSCTNCMKANRLILTIGYYMLFIW